MSWRFPFVDATRVALPLTSITRLGFPYLVFVQNPQDCTIFFFRLVLTVEETIPAGAHIFVALTVALHVFPVRMAFLVRVPVSVRSNDQSLPPRVPCVLSNPDAEAEANYSHIPFPPLVQTPTGHRSGPKTGGSDVGKAATERSRAGPLPKGIQEHARPFNPLTKVQTKYYLFRNLVLFKSFTMHVIMLGTA